MFIMKTEHQAIQKRHNCGLPLDVQDSPPRTVARSEVASATTYNTWIPPHACQSAKLLLDWRTVQLVYSADNVGACIMPIEGRICRGSLSTFLLPYNTLGFGWCVVLLKRHSSIVRRPGRTCKHVRSPNSLPAI